MARLNLTKSAIDAAKPQAQPVELRDTLVPGKVMPTVRKVFMPPTVKLVGVSVTVGL